MKKPKNIKSLIFLATAIFISVGTYFTIRWAKGYRPTKDGLTRGTGLLAANSFPKGAQVFINNKLTTATDDTLNMNPGNYFIEIKKDGFHTWSKNLVINEELVTQTNATLFPQVPSLTPLTFTGAINPVPSPDGNKIAFAVASASASTKNGLYVQELSSNPLALNRSPKQIAISNAEYNFGKAIFTWSPDSSSIITSFPDEGHLLLDSGKSNDTSNFRDVTVRLPAIFKEWEQEIARTERTALLKLPEFMMQVATQSATNVYTSPDGEKILYQATTPLEIPADLIPSLPSTSTQTQSRNIQPGNYYVYDLEEDTNFLIQEASLSEEQEEQKRLEKTLILENILTPIPPAELGGSTISAIKSITEGKTISEGLKSIMAQYSAIHVSDLQWFPDSYHLIITGNQGIDIVEYDGTNRITIFSGSFDSTLVYPWPDGSRIVTLLQFSPDTSPNLYAIKLK